MKPGEGLLGELSDIGIVTDFVDHVLYNAANNGPIVVVSDEISDPEYVRWFAEIAEATNIQRETAELMRQRLKYGDRVDYFADYQQRLQVVQEVIYDYVANSATDEDMVAEATAPEQGEIEVKDINAMLNHVDTPVKLDPEPPTTQGQAAKPAAAMSRTIEQAEPDAQNRPATEKPVPPSASELATITVEDTVVAQKALLAFCKKVNAVAQNKIIDPHQVTDGQVAAWLDLAANTAIQLQGGSIRRERLLGYLAGKKLDAIASETGSTTSNISSVVAGVAKFLAERIIEAGDQERIDSSRRKRASGKGRANRRAQQSPPTEEIELATTEDDELDDILVDTRVSGNHFTDYVNTAKKYYVRLEADEEVELVRRIEVGLYAQKLLEASTGVDANDKATAEQLADLQQISSEGQQAYSHLFHSNLLLVVKFALLRKGSGVPLMDLVQEGNLGLEHAIKKFNYDYGNKFSTYAVGWIRQSIDRYIKQHASVIRKSVNGGQRQSDIERARDELLAEGTEPTAERLAEKTGVSLEAIHTILNARTTSLTRVASDGSTYTLTDAISNSVPSNYEQVERIMLRHHVADAINTLDPLSAAIVLYHLGFTTGQEMSFREIGELVDLNRESARKYYNNALKELAKNHHLVDFTRD